MEMRDGKEKLKNLIQKTLPYFQLMEVRSGRHEI